jgi:uncharacterized membrane-anchored protein
MRLGADLVDAKGVSRLYRSSPRTRDLWFLVAAALVTMIVITGVMPPARLFLAGIWDQIQQLVPFLH